MTIPHWHTTLLIQRRKNIVCSMGHYTLRNQTDNPPWEKCYRAGDLEWTMRLLVEWAVLPNDLSANPANMNNSRNVVLILGQRLKRWPNIKTTLGQFLKVCWKMTCLSRDMGSCSPKCETLPRLMPRYISEPILCPTSDEFCTALQRPN